MFPDKNGTYIFYVYNLKPSRQAADVQVSINSRDIQMMPYNTLNIGYLEPVSVNYYELNVPQAGSVVFELLECAGEVQLSYSQDYDDFLAVIFWV